MKTIWYRLSGWSQQTFGSDEERSHKGPLRHLRREVEEAIEVEDSPDLLEELVDCLLLVFDAARRSGHTWADLEQACHDKLTKNAQRQYGPPDDEGVSEHVRVRVLELRQTTPRSPTQLGAAVPEVQWPKKSE
jgi:hypothetical protein